MKRGNIKAGPKDELHCTGALELGTGSVWTDTLGSLSREYSQNVNLLSTLNSCKRQPMCNNIKFTFTDTDSLPALQAKDTGMLHQAEPALPASASHLRGLIHRRG